VLELRLADDAGAVTLELFTEDEPVVVGRIGELVDSRAYDGAVLTRRAGLVDIGFQEGRVPVGREVEPRRTRHSMFVAGAIGWSWSKVPSDNSTGDLFIMVDEERGYDAAYQTVGRVLSGLDVLAAIEAPRVQHRGLAAIQPATIRSVRRTVDVQRA